LPRDEELIGGKSSEHAGFTGNHPPVKITPFAVDLAHGRDEILQIVVGSLEYRIDLLAAFSPG